MPCIYVSSISMHKAMCDTTSKVVTGATTHVVRKSAGKKGAESMLRTEVFVVCYFDGFDDEGGEKGTACRHYSGKTQYMFD